MHIQTPAKSQEKPPPRNFVQRQRAYLALSATFFLVFFSCGDLAEPPTTNVADTTSHDLIWVVSALGDRSSGLLRDVVLINDTLAYAAGEVYLSDSLGNWDPNAYNLAKWDGRTWSLLRVQFHSVCGQAGWTSFPTSSLAAFGEDDIWIAMDGDQVARWNGSIQTAVMCMPVSFPIRKLWGSSPSSVYAVGAGGNITHYAGGSWQKLESGTNLDFQDIWGPGAGSAELLAVASNPQSGFERKILRISGATVTTLSDIGVPEALSGVWFAPGQQYYVVGSGIYQKTSLADQRWLNGPRDITSLYVETIRGNAANDVFAAGDFGELLHFNGRTWKSYRDQTSLPSGLFRALALHGHQVFAVGENNSRPVIAWGRRPN